MEQTEGERIRTGDVVAKSVMTNLGHMSHMRESWAGEILLDWVICTEYCSGTCSISET